MPLLEELDKQGQFLFRWRSYVPGFILLLSFLFIPQVRYINNSYEQHLLYMGGCFFISILGLAVRCITIGFTPANTSGRNTKKQVADTVNQSGIYSTVRHPLYLGNFLMFTGVSLIVQNISFFIIFFFIYWFYYERIMFTEEQFLRNKFGNKYISWASKTPAIIPNVKTFQAPELNFSFKNIIKREYPSLFGLIIMFVLYDILIMYYNKGLDVDKGFDMFTLVQKYLFVSAIVFYSLTRLFVKSTKLLEVEGR
jgi:lipid A Kdo2 1-phosphate O-methyltransferase